MNKTTSLPPLLVALTAYAVDQPRLDLLERAIDTARATLQLTGDTHGVPNREIARSEFISAEGEQRTSRESTDLPGDQEVACEVGYGDAAYFLGFAMCYLLLTGKGGPQ